MSETKTTEMAAAEIAAIEAARMVHINSRDCEALLMAHAVLTHVRETMVADGEYYARLAHAESVLARIVKDSMMLSPVAVAALRAASEGLA